MVRVGKGWTFVDTHRVLSIEKRDPCMPAAWPAWTYPYKACSKAFHNPLCAQHELTTLVWK